MSSPEAMAFSGSGKIHSAPVRAALEPGQAQGSELVPLVVDLDGTLVRSDTLHEGIAALVAQHPAMLFRLPIWLMEGRAGFKQEVANRILLDPSLLPYDPDVLCLIAQARERGRSVALVSAADHRQVEAVAEHLQLFDLVVGTGTATTDANLRGAAKADLLVRHFGHKSFDYVGDSSTDIPVWVVAREAVGVRLSSGTRRLAKAQGLSLVEIGPKAGFSLRAMMRACRPHQWAKNLLIFLPVLTAFNLAALPAAALAFLCFSLVASAIYIVNDLLDLPSDRRHPRKRFRPFASGEVTATQGAVASVVLVLMAFALALLLPAAFLGVLLVYLVTTTIYSLSLKRKLMADVITLAVLYTLRIVAGSLATGIALSPWLLVFSMFLFFSLATIKRQAELEDLNLRGKTETAGRNLLISDLPVYRAMSVSAAQAAVLVFALYTQDAAVQLQFSNPNILLLICPVLMLWHGRMQLMTTRGFMTDDPLVFTMRDRVSATCGIVMLSFFLIAAAG